MRRSDSLQSRRATASSRPPSTPARGWRGHASPRTGARPGRRPRFFIVGPGWGECNLILAVIAVAVSTAGATQLSVDHLIRSRGVLTGWTGFLISAGGGIAGAAGHLATFYRSRATVPVPWGRRGGLAVI